MNSASPFLQHPSATPLKNHDGSSIVDGGGNAVTAAQYLATHPLQRDIQERRSPNNPSKIVSYLSGDAIIREMNLVFPGAWKTELIGEPKELGQVLFNQQEHKWVVGYMAVMRVSVVGYGSHEDVGFGEGMHETSACRAHELAAKSAITDAMKRACRHFGDRLGNALYSPTASKANAPITNLEALQRLRQRQTNDFSFLNICNKENAHSTAAAITATDVPPFHNTHPKFQPQQHRRHIDSADQVPPRVVMVRQNGSRSPSLTPPNNENNSATAASPVHAVVNPYQQKHSPASVTPSTLTQPAGTQAWDDYSKQVNWFAGDKRPATETDEGPQAKRQALDPTLNNPYNQS